MVDVDVSVGDERSAPIPAPSADDVHSSDVEGVGGAHDRADIEVLAHVLNGHVQGVGAGGEFGAHRLDAPVAEAVDDIAPVPGLQQRGIVTGVVGPGAPAPGPGPDPHLAHVRRPVLLRGQGGPVVAGRLGGLSHVASSFDISTCPTDPQRPGRNPQDRKDVRDGHALSRSR